ncbi:hypothetical protein CU661_04330 [Pseudomonas syringae pv. actinidifoliorum]|nr:hypothetical protein [Pseudomonas syringae pv. actinidifoliorum]
MLTVMVEKAPCPSRSPTCRYPGPSRPRTATAEYFEDLHKLLGKIFYYVIGLHVVAALWHHIVRKDNTLKRML